MKVVAVGHPGVIVSIGHVTTSLSVCKVLSALLVCWQSTKNKTDCGLGVWMTCGIGLLKRINVLDDPCNLKLRQKISLWNPTDGYRKLPWVHVAKESGRNHHHVHNVVCSFLNHCENHFIHQNLLLWLIIMVSTWKKKSSCVCSSVSIIFVFIQPHTIGYVFPQNFDPEGRIFWFPHKALMMHVKKGYDWV